MELASPTVPSALSAVAFSNLDVSAPEQSTRSTCEQCSRALETERSTFLNPGRGAASGGKFRQVAGAPANPGRPGSRAALLCPSSPRETRMETSARPWTVLLW